MVRLAGRRPGHLQAAGSSRGARGERAILYRTSILGCGEEGEMNIHLIISKQSPDEEKFGKSNKTEKKKKKKKRKKKRRHPINEEKKGGVDRDSR